jgi:glyoxylase-like metal-dependent hydrolase (beta-lactamase superfamily II)
MKRVSETPNLFRLTRMGAVNAYLVREQDGLTLVDTMIQGSADSIAGAAAEVGTPIVRIVATHAHADHVGSLAALASKLPEAELITSEREARLMGGDLSFDAHEPDTKLKGGMRKLDLTLDRTVVHGDRIASLEVVAAPGHTPGQIALLDTRDRSLIAADAFTTLGGVATSASPYWRFPFAGFATWSRATTQQTAGKLRDLEPSLLVTGHGPAVPDPVEAMAAALSRSA